MFLAGRAQGYSLSCSAGPTSPPRFEHKREYPCARPAGEAPTLRLFSHDNSPLAGQDARIKKRYVV